VQSPVAQASDCLAAERLYLQLRSAPGAPLVIGFAGRLDLRPAMEGPAPAR
jgi:hypothetical protein